MHANICLSTICMLSLVTTAGSQGDGEFHDLGPGNAVSGLSYDGSVAAGTGIDEYFMWTAADGVIGIGGQVPGGGIGGQAKISDDGTRISGTDFNVASGQFEMAYYDTMANMWVHLGGIGSFCTGGPGDEASSGWGISNDGTSVVGLGWFDFCGPAHGIQWFEASGMTNDLGSTVMDRSSRANGANEDGSIVVGWQDRADGFRQGAFWNLGVQSVILTPSGDPVSEASDVDAAGDWVVGIASFATADEAWRWSATTGVEMLGMDCPGCFLPRGFATGISNDGSVIVGFNRGFGVPPTGGVGFIWTEATGMLPLNEYLVDQGVDTGGFNFSLPLTISGDGRTIGGLGTPAGGFGGDGFVVTLPAEAMVAKLDIKPGSCPNSFNRSSNGILTAALLGGPDFDATQVDVSSLSIARADGAGSNAVPNEGPPGPHTTLDDVATPFMGEACDCHAMDGDGFTDVVIKFRTQEVVQQLELGEFPGGALVELVVSGALLDGTPFEASDCIRLVPPGSPPGLVFVQVKGIADGYIESAPPDLQLDGGGFGSFERTFPLTTQVTLSAEVQHAGSRLLGWMVDGTFIPMRTYGVRGSTSITLEVTKEIHHVDALYVKGIVPRLRNRSVGG